MGKPASITSTPKLDQGLGDLHLLGQVHAGAGRLLAVAERGVEDDDASRRCLFGLGHRSGVLCNRLVQQKNPKALSALGFDCSSACQGVRANLTADAG